MYVRKAVELQFIICYFIGGTENDKATLRHDCPMYFNERQGNVFPYGLNSHHVTGRSQTNRLYLYKDMWLFSFWPLSVKQKTDFKALTNVFKALNGIWP